MRVGGKSAIGALVAGLVGTACSSSFSPATMANDELVPGAAAQVVYEEISFAGGSGRHVTTVIDSATSRFTVTTCMEGVSGPQCPNSETTSRSGEVLSAARDRLFAKARSASFRALGATYSRPASNINEPDDAGWKLTVTANGRRRTVNWERGAVVPSVLTSFVCSIQVARGDLIICAE